MNNKEISLLIKEKEKRNKLKGYEDDFSSFAREQIKIITKDTSIGFIPFKFNECQERITEALDKQYKETGRVRAIILV